VVVQVSVVPVEDPKTVLEYVGVMVEEAVDVMT
jgi:hypothetical protein